MKRVRALELGYDNITLREPGDEFDMPDDAKAPWFVDASSDVMPVPKKQLGQTVSANTLSGVQKENAGRNDLI